MRFLKCIGAVLAACAVAATTLAADFPSSQGGAATGRISFKKTQLDTAFRSEGVAAADFSGDGKIDIAAGSVWYEAPDWKMHPVLEQPKEFNINGYSDTFVNFAADVNGDGRPDLLVVDFPGKQTWWFENPGAVGKPWTRRECIPETNNESPQMVDLFRDGKPVLLCGMEGKRMGYARPGADPTQPWTRTYISAANAPATDRFSHGLGIGDINGNGRLDVVVPQGWWEAPENPAGGAEWKFHPAPFGPPCAHMYVYDFDGDGDADVVSSSAHQYGIWFHEQTADGWKTHEIDKSFSQTHSMVLADINGDGLPDLVTGKRYWAHNGNDPGAREPAVVFWFELVRENGKAKFIPHQIDHDSGVGTQFEVLDVNGDGLLDIVTSNKKGVFYLEQVRD